MDDKYSTLLSVRELKLCVNYGKQGCFLHSPPSEGLGEVPNQLSLSGPFPALPSLGGVGGGLKLAMAG